MCSASCVDTRTNYTRVRDDSVQVRALMAATNMSMADTAAAVVQGMMKAAGRKGGRSKNGVILAFNGILVRHLLH